MLSVLQRWKSRASSRSAMFLTAKGAGGEQTSSAALLTRYFRALGSDPLIHIPDRMKEGYGPNAPALMRTGQTLRG